MSDNMDWLIVFKKLFKYLVIGLVMALSIKYIPEQQLKVREIITLSLIASVTFAILDMYSPTINVNTDSD
jgi:hypothetical protein